MCTKLTSRAFHAPAPEHAAITLIGAVLAPCVWSLAELGALPQSHITLTMVCEAAPFPARGWETVEWSGVPLALLLREAGINDEAHSVQVAGLDGTLTALSLDDLGEALLALKANGDPLSVAQGSPARLVVPGLSACAMPRFVQRLMAEAAPRATVAKTAPRALITHAERDGMSVRLQGQAVTGAGRVDAVAVSCDGGPEVTIPVTGSAPGVAGTWAVDWQGGAIHAAPQYTVRPLGMESAREPADTRPLARRWKAPLHQKSVTL